jgi:hypothetical protein
MAKETSKKDEHREEGPRSFGVILQKVGDGAAEAELSRELFGLTKTLKDEARMRTGKSKGSITLKLNLEAEGDDGVVKVAYDVKVVAPKPVRRNGHFWFTEGGNLTSQAPKQSKLPFQEVANERGIPNDLPLDDGGDAREA